MERPGQGGEDTEVTTKNGATMTSSSKKIRFAETRDLREECKGKRVLVVGDPHGCFDEVTDLLKLLAWQMVYDILIFAGDLVDRGPKILEMVNFVRYIENIYTVEGNHEDKFKRWMRGRPVHVGHALQMTIDAFKEEIEHPRKRTELQQWFEELPQMIRITDDIYVAHAGIVPYMPIDKQEADRVLRIRTADAAGNMPWWKWDRGEDAPWILFGHNIQPDHHAGSRALALDGGCVFGGELRGVAIAPDGKLGGVMTVQAKKTYYSRERIKNDER
jgi:hypothetical protein